jgi:Spy/CpxP family protein refolding chaperone
MTDRTTKLTTGIVAAWMIGAAAAGQFAPQARAADGGDNQPPPNSLQLSLPNPMEVLTTLNRLNLNEKQLAEIQKLLGAFASRSEQLLQRTMEAQRALRQAINAEPLDEKLIRRKADDLGAVLGDMAVEAGRLRADILAQLNKEQKELFAQMDKHLDRLDFAIARMTEFLRLLNNLRQFNLPQQQPR